MQQEEQNLLNETTEVVNKLAELRRQHNNFRRDEQQVEESAPMGSSLVEREEIPQIQEEVKEQVVIITDFQVRQFKALAEALGVAMTEDMMTGQSAENVSNAIIGAAIENGKSQEEIEDAMGVEVEEEIEEVQNEEVEVQNHQNEEIVEVRAMIPQQFDQMIGEDENSAPVEVVEVIEQIPKESIQVSQRELDELDLKYPNGALCYTPRAYSKPQYDELRLDIANLVQDDKRIKEQANFFVCSICTMVVKDPLECNGCQTLFCEDCIDPWRQNNSHCPKKCQGNEDVEFRTVHRYVQHDLQDLKFKCTNSGCNSVNKYSQATEHILKCDKLIQPCVQGCGLGIVGEDMTYHCVKQCHFYKKTCDQCGEFSTFPNKPGCSAQIAEHDCLQVVKQKLKEEREKVALLKEQNEQLKNGLGLDEDEEQEEEEQCQLTGLRCAEAHDLEVHEGDVDSYDGNPRCDLCQTEDLNEHPRFYRCQPCGYDVCEACANILCDDSEDE